MTADFVIEIQPVVPLPEGVVAMLHTAVISTLRHQQIPPPAELTLLLSDDQQLRQLNRDFRQIDDPTDVLSFPSGDTPSGMTMPGIRMPGIRMPYLGDIAISVPYAARQAAQAGHDLAAELQLLAIHGTLHLLGHDHIEPEEKAAMWSAQQIILAQLGLSHVAPTES